MPDGRLSSHASYGAALFSIFAGIGWNGFAALAGVIIGIATWFVNWYYRRADTKRPEESHRADEKRAEESHRLELEERELRIEKDRLMLQGVKLRGTEVSHGVLHRKTDDVTLTDPDTLPAKGSDDDWK